MPNETQLKAGGSVQSKGQSQASPDASTNQAEASTEGQTGRTYTKAEFDKMQSKYQKQINDLTASLRASETKASDLEDKVESLQDKAVSLQAEVERGIPDDVKEYRSKSEKDFEAAKKSLREANREVARLQGLLDGHEAAGRQETAQTLAHKFGVDVDVLLGFDTTEKMKAYALDNMDPAKAKTHGETGEPPPAGDTSSPAPKPAVISATSSGGETSDAQFWKQYGERGYNPTPADHKRAKELRDKMIRGG